MESYFVSAVSLAEIRFGIESVDDASLRGLLGDWLQHTVRPMFYGRTLQVSEDVMLKWRLLVEVGRKKRHTFSQPDLIIAATALCHGLTIVSRDTRDYLRAGAEVFDPWVG
jgi:toxin FitB